MSKMSHIPKRWLQGLYIAQFRKALRMILMVQLSYDLQLEQGFLNILDKSYLSVNYSTCSKNISRHSEFRRLSDVDKIQHFRHSVVSKFEKTSTSCAF